MKVRHFLYRAFDADGRLLYVGQSIQPEQRIKGHARQSPWFAEVAEWAVEEFKGDWWAWCEAEREAIRSERPVYNVQHNTHREIA